MHLQIGRTTSVASQNRRKTGDADVSGKSASDHVTASTETVTYYRSAGVQRTSQETMDHNSRDSTRTSSIFQHTMITNSGNRDSGR